jgi:septum formation protein
MRLVLASTSPSRRRILAMAGLSPLIVDPAVDEAAATAAAGVADAAEVVQLLATAKALAAAATTTGDALVLGGDSAFVLDGEVLGKPHRPEIAVQRWRAMRGRTGELLTGHALVEVRDGAVLRMREAVVGATVTFADVSDREIDAYVATGEPLQVAGAFTLEGRAAAFITAVRGDPHAVVGLSVAVLRRLAGDLGVDWVDLVAANPTAD